MAFIYDMVPFVLESRVRPMLLCSIVSNNRLHASASGRTETASSASSAGSQANSKGLSVLPSTAKTIFFVGCL